MLVTITHLRTVTIEGNGEALPVGKEPVGNSDALTGAGASAPAGAGVTFARVATDTAITINGFGASSSDYMAAGSAEYFPSWPGRTFTVALA